MEQTGVVKAEREAQCQGEIGRIERVGKPVSAAQCRGRRSEPVCPWGRDTRQDLSWKSGLFTGFPFARCMRKGLIFTFPHIPLC